MRNLLIARVCGADSDLLAATPDQRPGLAKAAALFSEEDLTRYFQILLQTDDSLRRAMDPRVHLEMGLLRLVNAARLAPLEELLAEAKSAGGNGPGGGSAPRTTGSGSAAPSFPSRTATAGAASSSSVANVLGQKAPVPQNHPGREERASESGRYKSEERVETRPSAIGVSGTGIGVAPALEPAEKSEQAGVPVPQVAAAPAAKENLREVAASGLDAAQVAEIKAGIQAQQKFIGELLEHSSRWELDGAELRIYFPAEKSTFAGLIEGRDTLEKIRGVSGKVLGRAVRVCAKLETGAAKDANASRAASSTQEIRSQFENDPMVKSMLQRFGGRISEVRRQGEE
jgi:DNA polymerase-3 subunit gamma/tau